MGQSLPVPENPGLSLGLMETDDGVNSVSITRALTSRRPLSALLSQALVAFTVEFDNEFERQMGEAGFPGARLSLVMWANVMRFVAAASLRRE